MGSDQNIAGAKRAARDRTRRDQRRRDATAEMSAAAIILKAVIFAKSSIVGVSGTRLATQSGIVTAVLGLIGNQNANGRTGRHAVPHAAFNDEGIALLTRGGQLACGTAQRELVADFILIHGDAGSKAVQHGADGGAVALSKQGDTDLIAKRVFHHFSDPILPSRTASAA